MGACHGYSVRPPRTTRGAWDACAPPLPTSPKENAMSKYSVEEVRKAAALISSVYPDEREVFYMLTAYAERIKADEESAVGYVATDNKIVFYVEDGWSKEVPPGTKLFAHPPAQAAQVDQVGELLAIIHGDGGHYRAEHGTEKAAADAIPKVYALMQKLAKQPAELVQGQPATPILNIRCESVVPDGVKGSTYLPVVRVEAEDDGSFTAVTNYWPAN